MKQLSKSEKETVEKFIKVEVKYYGTGMRSFDYMEGLWKEREALVPSIVRLSQEGKLRDLDKWLEKRVTEYYNVQISGEEQLKTATSMLISHFSPIFSQPARDRVLDHSKLTSSEKEILEGAKKIKL